VVAQTTPRVDLEQVIGETLPEDVGAVTRDAVAGCIDGYPPLSAQREVDDNGSVELMCHGSML
jgi:hypothetical protein